MSCARRAVDPKQAESTAAARRECETSTANPEPESPQESTALRNYPINALWRYRYTRRASAAARGSLGMRDVARPNGSREPHLQRDLPPAHEPGVSLGEPDEGLEQSHGRPRRGAVVGVPLGLVVLGHDDLGHGGAGRDPLSDAAAGALSTVTGAAAHGQTRSSYPTPRRETARQHTRDWKGRPRDGSQSPALVD